MSEPAPELVTTRLGGGRSARAIAVGVFVVLAGVAWIGFSGRQPAPPGATPAAPASGDTLVPSTTPRPSAAPLDPGIVAEIKPDGALPVYAGYGVELVIGGRRYPASLYELSPGTLSARYQVPARLASGTATLNLAEVVSSVSHDIVNPIDSWLVPLDPATPRELLLSVTSPGVQGRNIPALAQQGYRITAFYDFERPSEPAVKVLWVTVETAPVQPGPPEYHYSASVPITGGLLRTALVQRDSNTFVGHLEIDTRNMGGALELRIAHERSSSVSVLVETFDVREISLRPLRKKGSDGAQLLEIHVAAQTIDGPVVDAVARGYSLSVDGSRDETRISLEITLRIDAHNLLRGEDGIYGWPVVASPDEFATR